MSLVELRPIARLRDPLSFACAVSALVEQGRGDRCVPSAVLDRAVPFVRDATAALSPDFFRVLHRLDSALRRQETH